MAATIKFNSAEFDAALRAYAAVCKNIPTEVVNRKAYFIARRAIWYTPKADRGKMTNEIGPTARGISINTVKRGKNKGKSYVKKGAWLYAPGQASTAPALGLIINARRGRAGKPGLRGQEMAQAMKKVWGARLKSIAYINSGWITARDTFKRWAGGGGGLPPNDPKSVQVGRKKGDARPATSSTWRAKATLTNSASTSRDKKEALRLYGEPALARAFAIETIDTMDYVERKLREAAAKVGIKTR